MGEVIEYKGLSRDELNAIKNNIARPMRTTIKAERIARRTVAAAAKEHVNFYDEVIKLTPADLTPNPINIEQSMRDGEFKAMLEHGKYCDCGGAHHGDKALTPSEIERIVAELVRLTGTAFNNQIDQLAINWLDSYWGLDATINNLTPGKAGYWDQSLETYKWSFKKLEDTYKRTARRSSIWARNNPFEVELIRQIDPTSPFIQKIYSDGFELVSSKITREFVPQLKRFITTGLKDGQTWNEISRSITGTLNKGQLWHWQRLVRSEMAISIHSATQEQYNKAGIGFVLWSASPTRCPICDAIANSSGGWESIGVQGYYRLDNVPNVTGDTHPNCRCLIISQWRLPGVIEEQFEEQGL
ncbi:MAG: hypothetical protein GWN62_16945 [Aliifodinibius sp.]|nr:hypothetical protein [Fodinibius sp.]